MVLGHVGRWGSFPQYGVASVPVICMNQTKPNHAMLNGQCPPAQYPIVIRYIYPMCLVLLPCIHGAPLLPCRPLSCKSVTVMVLKRREMSSLSLHIVVCGPFFSLDASFFLCAGVSVWLLLCQQSAPLLPPFFSFSFCHLTLTLPCFSITFCNCAPPLVTSRLNRQLSSHFPF